MYQAIKKGSGVHADLSAEIISSGELRDDILEALADAEIRDKEETPEGCSLQWSIRAIAEQGEREMSAEELESEILAADGDIIAEIIADRK